MIRSCAAGFTIAVLTLLACSSIYGAPLYRVTDLGDLGGNYSYSTAIDGAGRVVGASHMPDGKPAAFMWQSGSILSLGTLSGGRSIANGLNDAGQVVGYSRNEIGYERAFLWQYGIMSDLGTLGGSSSYAQDINAAGWIIGSASNVDETQRAFLRRNGAMEDLGTLGGTYSGAFAINTCGQIVGRAATPGELPHAFLWQNGHMNDLGVGIGYARDINDYGTIVGAYSSGEEEGAFIWRDGQITRFCIGSRETVAYGINNIGEVVGSYYNDGPKAFYWRDGIITDLNAMLYNPGDIRVANAVGINDWGQIAAYGFVNGTTHALLLTPVPEPSSLLALASAVAGLGFVMLRRK